MTLGDRQRIFSRNYSLLLGKIYAEGYECAQEEGYRRPEMAYLNGLLKGSMLLVKQPGMRDSMFPFEVGGAGITTSLHCDKLAHDITLFKGGNVCDAEEYRQFADFWLTLHPDNHAGFYFQSVDAGHFSMGDGRSNRQ